MSDERRICRGISFVWHWTASLAPLRGAHVERGVFFVLFVIFVPS